MSYIVKASGLRKTFGDRAAVDDVGFAIERSETYGLLGPNGAGKTTTISMLCGLLERDAGSVEISGHRVDIDTPDARRAIGYVPQDLAIYPDLTAKENLSFFARLYELPKDAARRRIGEVLEVVGLSDRADDRTEEFSGGMKRRLNIGIGLLHKPDLLVLDEPTVGVDPQSRNAILASVEHLSDEGMAVLYTTHYMEEAERLCDRVGIIDQGRIIAEGTRRELVRTVGHRDRVSFDVAGFPGSVTQALKEVPRVDDVSTREGGIEVIVDGAAEMLPRLIEVVSSNGVAIKGVEVTEPDLEAVFLHLTGRALRD